MRQWATLRLDKLPLRDKVSWIDTIFTPSLYWLDFRYEWQSEAWMNQIGTKTHEKRATSFGSKQLIWLINVDVALEPRLFHQLHKLEENVRAR